MRSVVDLASWLEYMIVCFEGDVEFMAWTCVEFCVLFAPTRVYGSYNLYGSGLPYYRSFVRAHQDAETHRKTCRLTDTSQNNNKDTILSLTCKYDLVSLIKYNVIHHSFSSCSSSQVSLYRPPLNQLCQDDLPRTSNTPLYQSQVPFSASSYSTMPGWPIPIQLNVL